MNKIDILAEIQNALEEWTSLLSIGERQEVRNFTKAMTMALSDCDEVCLQEIKARLLVGKELKALEESVKSSNQKH